MKAAILSLLTAQKGPSFLRFLQSYRSRKLADIPVPASPEEAMRVGFDLGYQQGYGNGLKEGVDLGVDVGMGAATADVQQLPIDPELVM